MDTKQKQTYSLAEFREFRKRRAAEPIRTDELERRQRLGAQSDRILASQKPLPVPVEELIREARRYSG